jgi:saccharopine dehydrogenase (NAD+, L-lysine forming)
MVHTKKVKIGIIREGKTPPDARVALTPDQCLTVMQRFPGVEVVVQPSEVRCFPNSAYQALGIALQTDVADCDVLLGVKEVPIPQLIPEKTYLFFSHTIKKQPYNQELLRTILERRIRLIDYEVLTDDRGERLIAFGYYAGVVGAHNALWTYAQRTGAFALPRMRDTYDYAAIKAIYGQTQWPAIKIVITGGGRVAQGAIQTLRDMGIAQVSPADFLTGTFTEAVFTQLHAGDYARCADGSSFDKAHFYQHGHEYVSCFRPFATAADVFINCIFYDKKAPAFFTLTEMAQPEFNLQVIADVTCDIMPGASVPCTVQPSTIADPVYGFDARTGMVGPPFQAHTTDIMAIDNLPSELPRDASAFFGRQLIDNILPELLQGRNSEVIRRGMIAENGELGTYFTYLADYALAVAESR